MDLAAKIKDFQEKTVTIMEANPDINEVHWEIRDLPYKIFEDFRCKLNEGHTENTYIEASPIAGKMYYRPNRNYGRGCHIEFWSVPVTFKHTYEAIEEIPKT